MAEPRSGKTVTGLLRRRRLWIIGTVAAFVAAADVIALLTPVTYQASALLVIDQRVTSPTADLNAAITTGQLLAAHYIKMATSTAVLDGVCADAGDCSANALKSHVSASAVKGTDLLSVTVTDSSPSGATNLANLVAAKLLAEHRREVAASLKPAKAYLDGELSRIWKELGSAKPQFVTVTQAAYTTAYNKREAVAEQEARMDGSLSLVSAAAIPTAPAYSQTKLYLVAGLVIGLVVALILALLAERIDKRIFDTQELSDATSAPLVLAC